jgi:hypothetical protein
MGTKPKTKKVFVTNNITDVRKAVQNIGDTLNEKFYETKDLKVAQGAVQAYSVAINAAKTQLIYKKLTGTPGEMDFLK